MSPFQTFVLVITNTASHYANIQVAENLGAVDCHTPHCVCLKREDSAIHAITTTTTNKQSYNFMSGPAVCGDVCKEVASGGGMAGMCEDETGPGCKIKRVGWYIDVV